MKRVCCRLIVLGLFMGVAGQAEAGYTFVTIAPPGSSESSAIDINDAGQIVGQYGFVPVKTDIGFLLSGGSYSPIDPPGSTGSSAATGINNGGQIVVSNFLLSGGSYTALPEVPGTGSPPGTGGSPPLARGINDAGQIVGYYAAGGSLHGFLLSGGSYTTINVPGSEFSEAFQINNAGQIVGAYTTSDGKEHGFLLSGGSYTTIDVPGATYTAVGGINDAGQIVGSYGAGGTTHGFLLSGGSYTTIDVPGANETYASGINDAGEIVGADFGIGSSDLGFLATPGAVPEPSALTMFGIGTLGILVYARFRLRPDAL
jgi:probable HAF family extracellular repeat protein